ncbi:MAG: hypothetical protein IJJ33_18290 [Victivallales bacterium]|nr:hypothetical protein [Victivallales bacterium]
MKTRFFLAFLAALPLLAADLLPYRILSAKLEGKYSEGTPLKGTKEKYNVRSNVLSVAGWNEIPAFLDHNTPACIQDGELFKRGLRSYDWSHHSKRIVLELELAASCEIEYVEVWENGYGSQMVDKAEIYTAAIEQEGNKVWTAPSIATHEAPPPVAKGEKPTPRALTVKVGKTARWLKLVCSNYRPMVINVTEVRLYGKGGADVRPIPQVPEGCWRIELETIPGPWHGPNPTEMGGGGMWMEPKPYLLKAKIPGEDKRYTVWMLSKGPGLKIALNWASPVYFRTQVYKTTWTKVGVCSGGDFRLEFSAIPQPPSHGPGGRADGLLLSPDPQFDPNGMDTLVLTRLVPELKRDPEFSETLLAENPDMPPEEFVTRMLNHYRYPIQQPRPVIDENNSLLVGGQPFFPILSYGLSPSMPEFREAGLNTAYWRYGGWTDASVKYVIGGRERFAFDRQVIDALNMNPANVAYIHTYDEPDGHPEFTRPKFLMLNALMKALFPGCATSVNFASSSQARDCFVISDALSVDHYPIASGKPAMVTRSIDYMRYYGENRPLQFIAQAYRWPGQRQRFPTADEMTAMAYLALVHCVKALNWYEYRATNSKDKCALNKDDYPEQWSRFCAVNHAIGKIVPGLLGPEVEPPYQVLGETKAEFRVLVTAKRDQAWLLAVNAEYEPATVTLDFGKGPLAGLSLIPFTEFGGRLLAGGDTPKLELKPCGVAVLEIASTGLTKLRKRTHREIMDGLYERVVASVGKGAPDIELPMGRTVDLLESWKSALKPERATLAAKEDGLHLDFCFRFIVGRKSLHTKRDDPVWKDICLEMFFGRPGDESQLAHLMVNTLNTQADTFYARSTPTTRVIDTKRDYTWASVAAQNGEYADFQVTIPWATLAEMTGLAKGETFSMNLYTTGSDWSGIAGQGMHQPLRFGKVTVR